MGKGKSSGDKHYESTSLQFFGTIQNNIGNFGHHRSGWDHREYR